MVMNKGRHVWYHAVLAAPVTAHRAAAGVAVVVG
jgi:hypothetical protein